MDNQDKKEALTIITIIVVLIAAITFVSMAFSSCGETMRAKVMNNARQFTTRNYPSVNQSDIVCDFSIERSYYYCSIPQNNTLIRFVCTPDDGCYRR